MRKVLILSLVVTAFACSGRLGSMAQTTASAAASATRLSDGEGSIELIMAALTTVVNDIAHNEREFATAVVAAMVQLDLGGILSEQGVEVALTLLCAAEAPADMPPLGSTFELASDLDEAGDDFTARLVISSEITEDAHPISLEITAHSADMAQVRLRGGGWLLCALFDADLEIDGELWDLPIGDEMDPTLTVSSWDPTGEAFEEDASVVEMVEAVEVVFAVPIPRDALLELLSADQLRFWVHDEALDVAPNESESARGFRTYLLGEPDSVSDDSLEGDLVIEPEDGVIQPVEESPMGTTEPF